MLAFRRDLLLVALPVAVLLSSPVLMRAALCACAQEKGEWSDADLEAVMDRSSLFPVRPPSALP